MAMFTAHFDASGHPDDPHVHYLTVAGFLASAEQWIAFERKWKKVLAKYDVPYLHMKEFSHSQGAFKGWDQEPKKQKRNQFMAELVNLVLRHLRHSFAMTISLDDYRANEAKHHIRTISSPLAIAGVMAIEDLVEVATAMKQPLHEIRVFFEDGDADKHNLEEWVKGIFGIRIHFESEMVPFEACDLIAYEHLQASKKVMPEPGVYAIEDLRKAFQRLHEVPHTLNGADHWGVVDNPSLEESTKRMLASDRRPKSK
jgi:hypothetical protein